MAYEHDDPRAADPGSGQPPRIEGDAGHGSDLPADRVPQGPGPRSAAAGDGPSAIGGLEPDVSLSRLDDDLASVLMAGGLLAPVLADVDRDLGFPPPQAPDLATAFLAALDGIDDRRFVTPPPPEPPTEPQPAAITHAAEFDHTHEEQTPPHDSTNSETPIAGLLTMGERTEPTKPPLVRVYDAPHVEPIDPPMDRDAFARDTFDHDALDDASAAAAALALDESAPGDRVEDEPEPMTVAEWAATFVTIEPVTSEPGAFEDGAPIDLTVEQRASDEIPASELDAIQDVIPFDDPPAPMHEASPHDVPSPDVPSPDLSVRAASFWDEPLAPPFAAKPVEPEPLDDVPFGMTPIARGVPVSFATPFDDLTAFERPIAAAIGGQSDAAIEPAAPAPAAFEASALSLASERPLEARSPFDAESALDPSAFEPTVLEPTVLDDSATFDEPASFDMPAAIEAAETDAPAVEPEPEPDVLEDLQEYVVFSLGELRCVVPIRNVIEVGRIPDAAPVPNSPAWLHGLGNLRGQVLTLIDLKAFFGVGRIKQSTGRMVVLRADADEVTGAVMVDQVHQIVSLSPSRFRQAPATLPERSTQFVWGACDYGNFTMIGLDVDGVLGVESLTEAAAEAAV